MHLHRGRVGEFLFFCECLRKIAYPIAVTHSDQIIVVAPVGASSRRRPCSFLKRGHIPYMCHKLGKAAD